MRILGLETSCDETSIAILETDGRVFKIEKSLIASQAAKHAEYGGVVPEVAARCHVDVLFPLLKAAGVSADGFGIDVIAVTAGPGLVPALRIGVEAAKALAFVWHKPLVAVNHMEGHVSSAFLPSINPLSPALRSDSERPEGSMAGEGAGVELPAVCLLVSGGHTELLLMKNFCEYEFLGRTRDDAAGEAFDKVANLLGLPYPGGPQISKQALLGKRDAIDFPRPMMTNHDDLDFSFSGLKTAVAVYLRNNSPSPVATTGEGWGGGADVCASFEQAVIDVLVEKTKRAVKKTNPKSVIVSGGVSANLLLREEMKKRLTPLPVHFPYLEFTGDNAAMIAAAGYFRAVRGEFTDPLKLEADPNLRLA
ncbi:MAG: tRNA (adenosine(37)-N6)-threonylcarbamoyltransferase complex transferase subunit TsaD [Candidatus Uhrbacteria bacterium]